MSGNVVPFIPARNLWHARIFEAAELLYGVRTGRFGFMLEVSPPGGDATTVLGAFPTIAAARAALDDWMEGARYRLSVKMWEGTR